MHKRINIWQAQALAHIKKNNSDIRIVASFFFSFSVALCHTEVATHICSSSSLPQSPPRTHIHTGAFPPSVFRGDQYSEQLSRSAGRWSIKPRHCVALYLQQPSPFKRSTVSPLSPETHCVCLNESLYVCLCTYVVQTLTHMHRSYCGDLLSFWI